MLCIYDTLRTVLQMQYCSCFMKCQYHSLFRNVWKAFQMGRDQLFSKKGTKGIWTAWIIFSSWVKSPNWSSWFHVPFVRTCCLWTVPSVNSGQCSTIILCCATWSIDQSIKSVTTWKGGVNWTTKKGRDDLWPAGHAWPIERHRVALTPFCKEVKNLFMENEKEKNKRGKCSESIIIHITASGS